MLAGLGFELEADGRLDRGQGFEERRPLGPLWLVLRWPVLGRPVLLVLLVRMGSRAVMMLRTVMPVMTLASLLIHDRLLKGVGEKGKYGSPDYRKMTGPPQEHRASNPRRLDKAGPRGY
jgi:hypothetical protein